MQSRETFIGFLSIYFSFDPNGETTAPKRTRIDMKFDVGVSSH